MTYYYIKNFKSECDIYMNKTTGKHFEHAPGIISLTFVAKSKNIIKTPKNKKPPDQPETFYHYLDDGPAVGFDQ